MKKIYSLLLLTGLILLGAQTVKADGVMVAGSFNGWNGASNPMSDEDGDGIYTAEISITGDVGGDVTFKIVDVSWYGDNNLANNISDINLHETTVGENDDDIILKLPWSPFTATFNYVKSTHKIYLTIDNIAGHDVTVVGVESLTGFYWDETATANNMVENEGVYTWNKYHVNLPAGNVEFKVAVNHNWDIAFPHNNYQLAIAEAGYYNVNVTFNWSTRTVTATAVQTSVEVAASYALSLVNTPITLTANATNFSDTEAINYQFYYSKDGADYVSCGDASTSATHSFTPTAGGNYTFKVVASIAATGETAEAVTSTVRVAGSWTIAGDSILTGYKWDATAVANDMEFVSDGLFRLTKNHVFIPAGTFYYKAFINHVTNLDQYPGEGNQNYYFENAGYYNITFTLNWAGNAVSAEATFVAPKVELGGEFNGWHAQEMTTTDGENYTLTLPALTAGEYMFRVRRNEATSWNGTEGDGRMLRTNCKNWELPATENGNFYNCGLIADLDGEYVFNYVFSTNRISITYPMTFSRTVTNTNYGTLCLPCAATLSGATAYTINELHLAQGYVTLIEVEGNLVAGKAYIIKPTATTISANLEGDAVVAPLANDYFHGVWGNTQQLGAAGASENDIYVLYDNKLCKLEGEGLANVTSTKAYFQIPEAYGAPAVLRIVEGENNATAMENLDAAENTTKFIRNGVLYIIRNGVTYDAMGKQVK